MLAVARPGGSRSNLNSSQASVSLVHHRVKTNCPKENQESNPARFMCSTSLTEGGRTNGVSKVNRM